MGRRSTAATPAQLHDRSHSAYQTRPWDAEESASALMPGLVLGVYQILHRIGEGGTAQVYLAEHLHLGRKVALKILRSEHAQRESVTRRFIAEARALSRVAHENIVEVTDFVHSPEGRCYIVMEYLKGEPLSELLARNPSIPLESVLAIGSQIASALGAAHAAGVIHRDLKPDNVFLVARSGRENHVKILDFGVAKTVAPPASKREITAAGVLVGTPQYMSPEQASGDPVDERTDVYSLGLLLYELVTGKPACAGPTMMETLIAQLTETPQPASLVASRPIPPALDRLIIRCMAKDRAQRPSTMRGVEAELVAIARDLTWEERRSTLPAPVVTLTPSPHRTEPRRRRGLHVLLGLAGAFATIAFAFSRCA